MSKPPVLRGEAHGRAKYSDATIAKVRKNYRRWVRISSKISPKAMAHRFKMPYSTLMKICYEQIRTESEETK
jgi:hypothetical protein